MNKPLFKQFPDISSKQWKQKIQVDLKGADYNDSLIWKTSEGIDVKPFYHQDEFETRPQISTSNVSQFKICQTIYVADTAKSNTKAKEVISKGAEALKFIIPTTEVSIKNLLDGIDTKKTKIYIDTEFLDASYTNEFDSSIHVNTDIIGNLSRTGNWFTNLQEDHEIFTSIVKHNTTFSIDSSLYQNAGATIVQQLAYTLSHANEYLNHFDNILDKSAKAKLNIIFNVSVGTNYFFEISKLRALRQLWETLASEYEVNTNCHVFASPSKRNKTIYDYNTNMLRTTTECMSAVLGGADSVNNLPYDAIYHKDNEFGERISRNQLLILKHESYFDKVDNPTDGAYYIESITTQLAEKALALFKNIESNGGFLNQLKEGTIQRKIKESAASEKELFNNEKLILLGTNKHPNPEDKMKEELEIYPFVKTNSRKTIIEPIIEKRLSEKLDINRLEKE